MMTTTGYVIFDSDSTWRKLKTTKCLLCKTTYKCSGEIRNIRRILNTITTSSNSKPNHSRLVEAIKDMDSRLVMVNKVMDNRQVAMVNKVVANKLVPHKLVANKLVDITRVIINKVDTAVNNMEAIVNKEVEDTATTTNTTVNLFLIIELGTLS